MGEDETKNSVIVSEETINSSIKTRFRGLIDKGYIFTIQNLNEYIEGREGMRGLIGLELPRIEWQNIYNVSLRYGDVNHAKYSWPLEFTVIGPFPYRELRIGNLYVDPGRRNKGEGKEMIVAVAGVAQDLGFDRIMLSGGPYLENDDKGEKVNILDWYGQKFPKLGNLRERVERDPEEAFLPVEAIL